MTNLNTTSNLSEELFSLHNERFIRRAYQLILNREADSAGFSHYLNRLRSGSEKIEILADLKSSNEGKSKFLHDTNIENLIAVHMSEKKSIVNRLSKFFNSFNIETIGQIRAINNKISIFEERIDNNFFKLNDILTSLNSKLNEDLTPSIDSQSSQVIFFPEQHVQEVVRRYDPIGDRYQDKLSKLTSRFNASDEKLSTKKTNIKISILMPVYKVPLVYLEKAIDSVKNQTYNNWELCIVDDGSNDDELASFLVNTAKNDNRIKVNISPVNRGISATSNAALAMSTGDYITLLDNDDVLTHDALEIVANKIIDNPKTDWLYSDECKMDESGNPTELFTKPDWSPLALFNCMYTGHLTVYRKSIVLKVGGFRSEFDFSQDYDLALRISEVTSNVIHIDEILYGWRMIVGSSAQGDKPYARASNIAALQDTAVRRNISGEALAEPAANHLRVATSSMNQMVSIIVPSDNLENIKKTLTSISENTLYKKYEIIVVTNSRLIAELKKLNYESNVLLVPFDKVFNFSEKCNVGAKHVSGEIIVFFNDDVRVVSQDWIEMILEGFVHPSVGIVGPKLLYENYLIQHAGMVTGVRGMVGTAFHCLPHETTTHFGMGLWMREVSLICGACLAVRTSVFNSIDGYDAINAPISHSDVDLCFRVRDAGYSCLYTPHATLIHIGHLSISETEKQEVLKPTTRKKDKSDIFLLRRWGRHTSYDPYFPPQMRDLVFHDSPEKWQLHANVPPMTAGGKDILLISHDLTGSGAPRIVFETARVLRELGHFVVVASPSDGTYRCQLNDLGVPVIIDELLLRQHDSLERFAKNFDLVIANTVVTWPAVKQLSHLVETHWYIHEISLLQHLLNIEPGIKDAFTAAKKVWVGSSHAAELIVPYRPDVLVLKYGVHPLSNQPNNISAKNPLNVSLFGSYEPRKGQDIAVAAFLLLPQEYRDKLRLTLFGRILDEDFYRKVEFSARGVYEITLKTELPYEKYMKEMLSCQVLLVASRDDTLPFVSIDALGAGKVLLCTSTTGTSAYIKHGVSGFIAEFADPQSVANILHNLVDEHDQLVNIGKNGKKVFETQFSVQAFTNSLLNACDLEMKPSAPQKNASAKR